MAAAMAAATPASRPACLRPGMSAKPRAGTWVGTISAMDQTSRPLDRHIHHLLVGIDQLVADLGHGAKRQRCFLHLQHYFGEIHILVARLVSVGERSRLVLHGRDAVDGVFHQIGEIRRLRGGGRRARNARGAGLQRAHLRQHLRYLHAAHGYTVISCWSWTRGTLMPAAFNCCSLWRSVRGLIPKRSAVSLRLPPVTRSVARINSRSRSLRSLSRPESCATAGSVPFATAVGALAAGGAIRMPVSRSPALMLPPEASQAARCTMLFNSRALPGQSQLMS